jgi:FecR-like protein
VKREPLLPVEVEPFSDARWARVERELFAKLDESQAPDARVGRALPGRVRLFAWAGGIAAVAAGVFLAVHPGRAVRSEDRLSLATTDSTSQFTVGESSLTVAPRSLVMVRGDDERGIDVVLDRGTVTCEVAPRHGRPPFQLDAGEVRVRVVGTKFTVTREDGSTSVDVEQGAVEVSAWGVVTLLHDGGHWPSRSIVSPPSVPEVAQQSTPSGSSDLVAASPTRSPMRGRRHLERPAAAAAAGAAESTTTTESTVTEPTTPTATSPWAQQAFEAAAGIERTNPDKAAAAYRQLVASGTDWAPNALFALGRLEADRGHRAEATRLLNAYLARYPHGINADDARGLLARMR